MQAPDLPALENQHLPFPAPSGVFKSEFWMDRVALNPSSFFFFSYATVKTKDQPHFIWRDAQMLGASPWEMIPSTTAPGSQHLSEPDPGQHIHILLDCTVSVTIKCN